jgi:hypothetical protein
MESASESEDDSVRMLIDEQEGLSQSQSGNSDDAASSEASDVDVEVKTPKSSTTQKERQELSLANGSFLGRAIFTPDSTLPIGMKRSSQVMLYAVPYNPNTHANMLATLPELLCSLHLANSNNQLWPSLENPEPSAAGPSGRVVQVPDSKKKKEAPKTEMQQRYVPPVGMSITNLYFA